MTQKNPQEQDNVYNYWLTTALWLGLIATGLAVVFELYNIISGTKSLSFSTVINLLVCLCTVIGTFLMLKINRVGYYLIMGSRIILSIITLITLYTFLKSPDNTPAYLHDLTRHQLILDVVRPIGQIVFLSLLMLLKKNGKNAYVVLWDKINM